YVRAGLFLSGRRRQARRALDVRTSTEWPLAGCGFLNTSTRLAPRARPALDRLPVCILSMANGTGRACTAAFGRNPAGCRFDVSGGDDPAARSPENGGLSESAAPTRPATVRKRAEEKPRLTSPCWRPR